MNQPLVVMTYPGHFLLTALTIQSYFQHHPLVPITVIADDLSESSWDSYIKDCQWLYDSKVIPVSSISVATQFNSGWIRQQIVKLYLDQVLPYDIWFFTDGDVEYHYPAPHNSIPYVITRGGNIQDQQNACVAKLLGIANPGVWAEHPDMNWQPGTRRHQVCVSNPPFRTMQVETLIKLRQHIEQLHKTSLTDLLMDADYSLSEWELIASFQHTVLKENVPLVYYPTNPIGEVNKGFLNYCSTCFATDSAYTRDWWKQKGITVPDNLWNNIVNISK